MRLVDFCRAYAELSSSSFDLRALGHKSIRDTQICINLEQAIFNEGESSEYTIGLLERLKELEHY